MQRTVLALTFVLAACGGKSKPATTTTDEPAGDSHGRMAAPGTILGDTKAYEQLTASTIALPAGPADMQCAGTEATLGAQVGAWLKDMGGVANATCDGNHCTVTISSKVDPSCDTNHDAEGCEGSAMMIEWNRDDAGTIDAASVMCMGAG